jgi:Fe-S-cluster containining protein
MLLNEWVQPLEEFYEKCGQTFHHAQVSQGLNCLEGCGACCLNPEVEANWPEMLPLAIHLSKLGQAENLLDKLQKLSAGKNQKHSCILYQRQSEDGEKGQCSQYKHRPLLCRVFGASVYTNKRGDAELSLCGKIKDKMNESEQNQNRLKELDLSALPKMKEWSYQMMQIHPQLMEEKLPINEALKLALEKVLFERQLNATFSEI